MLTITNTEVLGFDHAIRGMRNPLNSHDKSDSYWTHICDYETLETANFQFFVGDADEKLMKQLAKSGSDHAKYLRMITVYADITAPMYWFKEYDTYKVGTVANSTSTMHKIHAKAFTLDDFSHEHLLSFHDYYSDDEYECTADWPVLTDEEIADKAIVESYVDVHVTPFGIMTELIEMLNKCRKLYLETNDKRYWWQMIQLLPSSYNQTRTVMLNYEVLRRIYHSRRNHKLDEWHTFCEWIESLPHSDLITGEVTAERKKTNGDWVRGMTDIQLAKWVAAMHGLCRDFCPMSDDCDGENCDASWVEWFEEAHGE